MSWKIERLVARAPGAPAAGSHRLGAERRRLISGAGVPARLPAQPASILDTARLRPVPPAAASRAETPVHPTLAATCRPIAPNLTRSS